MEKALSPDRLADIEAAVDVMRRGGVILYPTDTVWGMGCDATCREAVDRIYAIKRRPDSKALIMLVDSMEMLERHVADIPEAAKALIDSSDRPLTVVYERGVNIAPNLTAEDGSVGVRLTRHVFSAELCRRLGRPVVSTSVNHSGEAPAKFFGEIPQSLLDEADYVALSERELTDAAMPSKVVKVSNDGKIEILRP